MTMMIIIAVCLLLLLQSAIITIQATNQQGRTRKQQQQQQQQQHTTNNNVGTTTTTTLPKGNKRRASESNNHRDQQSSEIDFFEAKKPENSVEYQLYNNLIGGNSRYMKHVRPVLHHQEAIIVEVGMSVMMIEELIERDQIMVMAAAIKMKWTDCFLSWNPERYGNLTWMAVSSSSIWVPDISIVNSPEPFSMTRKVTHVDIDHNGEVGFYPSGRLTTRCNLHIAYFPFDHQHCEVFLESWIHPSDYLKIVPYEKYGQTVDIKEYYTNHQWAILSYEVNMGSADYDGKNFSSITFVYMLKRKSQYYFMYFIFPQLLLAVLQTLSHTLPVEHPGRMAMLTSLFIGTSVTQAGIAVHIPKSSESMSLLQIYMLFMSINLAVALIVTFVMMYAVLRYPNEEPSMTAIVIAFFSIVWPAKPGDEDYDSNNAAAQHRKRSASIAAAKKASQASVAAIPPSTLRLIKDDDGHNVVFSSPEVSSPSPPLTTKPSVTSSLIPRPLQRTFSPPGSGYFYDYYDEIINHVPTSDSTAESHIVSTSTAPPPAPTYQLQQPPPQHRVVVNVNSSGRPQSSLMPKSQLLSLLDGGCNGGGSNSDEDDEAENNHAGETLPGIRHRKLSPSAASGEQPLQSGSCWSNNKDQTTSPKRSRSSSSTAKNKNNKKKKAAKKRGQAASLEETRELKRRWLLYCVAVDKTIMYANAAWNIAVPVVLFVIIPATASPFSTNLDFETTSSDAGNV